MEVGVGLRGVSQEQDTRFSDKDRKLLRTTKFPPEFDQKVDMRKVELEVMKPWIAKTVNTLLGFEDEVVIEYVSGLLEDTNNPVIDPKRMQVSLTGFLEAKTPEFMVELWRLLLSAQASPLKVPPEFIEEKKKEMAARREKEERAVARREEEVAQDQRIDAIRQRERSERRDQRSNDTQRRPPPRDDRWDARPSQNGRAERYREEESHEHPRARPRKRFESPPRESYPRRSVSPRPGALRETRRGRSRTRSSSPPRASPRPDPRVGPSLSPVPRRRRSSTPPRSRYPVDRRRPYRHSRSPSPRPRQRRRDSGSRSRSRSPRSRRGHGAVSPRRRSPSPYSRRRQRSPSSPPSRRRRTSTPRSRERSITPDDSRVDMRDHAFHSVQHEESLEDREAALRAQVLRRKVEATRGDRA